VKDTLISIYQIYNTTDWDFMTILYFI